MSFDAVIQRVDQLLAAVGQLDPAQSTATTATTSPTHPTTAASQSPTPSSSSFSSVLDRAQGGAVPSEVAPYKSMIARSAARWGVDPALIQAVIQHESGGNANATSSAGAMGLMQLMPETARALGVTNPYDPAQSIDAGTHYLSTQLQRFGDVKLAIAAYDAGGAAVARYGGIPPYAETQASVPAIYALYQSYRQEDGE
jgi:soluble lytic murein transglycosylase-like protein